MEAVRLFLLKILLSAIIMNVVFAKQNMGYNTISTFDHESQPVPQKMNFPKAYRRSWTRKSSADYKSVPPYLVFNKKTGAYYPYYKFPYESNYLRRIQGA